ncbi:MAG: MarR family winged helix-turn-helix transcriptional regulator [Pacificimonas sp.]
MPNAPDAEILTLDSFLPYRLSLTSNVVSRALAESYKSDGLKMAEWRVLAVLAANAPCSQRDLTTLTQMDKVTVSRAVRVLVDRDLVDQSPNPDDGRSQLLAMTAAGLALYKRVMPQAVAMDRKIFAALSESEEAQLFALLEKVETAADLVLAAEG